MNEIYDIIIIGGGASGLFCASQLNKEFKIAILEKDIRIGKKILATGNGRCNLTNKTLSSLQYNQNIDVFLKTFNNFDTLKYFNDMGLMTYCDEEGRVYPISNTANSVLDIIRLNIGQNVDIFTEIEILNISKNKIFNINLKNGKTLFTKQIIYACGGNSTDLIKNLHNDINSFNKSLVSLQTNNNKHLNNIRVHNVKATLKIGDNTFYELGEILFKDNAISGIMIFNLSSYMARIKNYCHKIYLDLLPDIAFNNLIEILERRKNNKIFVGENFLIGIFHSALSKNIMEKVNFDTKNTQKIAFLIKNYEIITKNALNNNQVFNGGIKLESLSTNLESKETSNLFFIGECVDVDGLCGGYNLQWAWTSAFVVAKFLNENLSCNLVGEK